MLKHIGITNFRSCYLTNISFNESVCALVGKNGVGKTNILRCIEWIASSSISTEPIKPTPAGNSSGEVEEVSVNIAMELDNQTYEYDIAVPLTHSKMLTKPPALRDSLTVHDERNAPVEIFRRENENINVSGRPEPIRIARSTSSIAALLSLLPQDDLLQKHLMAVTSFFAGVRYYALEERAVFRDFVTDQQFNEWQIKYINEGLLTDSVALRLIHMWIEDREMFNELKSLLGNDGLGLLESLEIGELNMAADPTVFKEAEGPQAKIYMPVFMPSGQMGGAGRRFPFSNLSIGTRRVIRIVTSLLFDKRSIMLMEQPEDSVHPGLLRKLIDMLRSYSQLSQILFTTHSSEILDILRPEEVLLATADLGRTTVRELSQEEISRARRFLNNDGSLSDFLEPFDE